MSLKRHVRSTTIRLMLVRRGMPPAANSGVRLPKMPQEDDKGRGGRSGRWIHGYLASHAKYMLTEVFEHFVQRCKQQEQLYPQYGGGLCCTLWSGYILKSIV